MKIQQMAIKDIHPYKNNPRKNDSAVDYVVESISRFGFNQPIVVDKDGIIIVGHTRFKAAKKLGLQTVPVICATDLTEEQTNAYRLADNKTNQYAEWDDILLTEELRKLLEQNSIHDTSLMTAFSELEIDRLLNGDSFNEDQNESAKQRTSEIKNRLGLLVLKNSYVNRGVATAVNGWLEWGLRNNVQVDVISDSSDLHNNQFTRYETVSRWISEQADLEDQFDPEVQGDSNDFADYKKTNRWITETELTENRDPNISMRYPFIRLDEATKLRGSLIQALSEHSYDALIVNTLDVLVSVASIGLHNEFPNLYYITHSEDDIGLGKRHYFTPITHGLLKSMNINILCQSERTQRCFLASSGYDPKLVRVQPYHIGQPEFQEFKEIENRRGILYIGPYEDRKDPEVYIRACKDSGLPALLITPSETSARKFKRRFLQEGIEHEIHVALTGKNKVAVMRTAAVAIIPSKEETFCFTAWEAAHCCPTIVPLEREWTENHSLWCHRVPLNEITETAKQLYGQPVSEQTKQAILAHSRSADEIGLTLITHTPHDEEINNALTKWLKQVGQGRVRDFFRSRPTVVLDELYYVFKLLGHEDYEITHNMGETYIRYLKYQDNVNDNLTAMFNLENSNE